MLALLCIPPNPNTRTLTLNLRGTEVEIEALLRDTTATIVRATAPGGLSFDVQPDDLDTIEEALFDETTVEALDFTLHERRAFQVRHNGDHIVAIFTGGGALVPSSSEQFTETAEAFHIDRQWAMIDEADVQGHARQAYGW